MVIKCHYYTSSDRSFFPGWEEQMEKGRAVGQCVQGMWPVWFHQINSRQQTCAEYILQQAPCLACAPNVGETQGSTSVSAFLVSCSLTVSLGLHFIATHSTASGFDINTDGGRRFYSGFCSWTASWLWPLSHDHKIAVRLLATGSHRRHEEGWGGSAS